MHTKLFFLGSGGTNSPVSLADLLKWLIGGDSTSCFPVLGELIKRNVNCLCCLSSCVRGSILHVSI